MPFQRILVPVDFSECSRRALEYALALAPTLGARVEALHVVGAPELLPLDMPLSGDAIEAHHERAAERMRELVSELADERGAAVEVRIETGMPHDVIAVASQVADLIVMGTHGRSKLAQFLLGSVAERTVRTSRCPVLTVPPARNE